MTKPLSDYIIALGATPLYGFAFGIEWLFYGAWKDNGHLILATDKRIRIGGWRWWWYRSMLKYPTAERCTDCRKIIDSIHTVNLCECAHELDMKGME